MSYDKKISIEPAHLKSYGVAPVYHDLKKCLPPGNKEPEPKILLPCPNAFSRIRALFCNSQNAFMIPGQLWPEKNPLVSLLLDTVENNNPTAEFELGKHSLRYRYEINPQTGEVTQRDMNEKSASKGEDAVMIGGCVDRDEREIEIPLEQTLEEGYEALKNKYRNLDDPAYCDDIPFEHLHVLGGYTAARTEYGFAVKHPRYPVMFVFEACEDIFETYTHDMAHTLSHLYEFEFEPRQVWGKLPKHVETSEDFREFLYSSMNEIRNSICRQVPGAMINPNSKADFVKEYLKDFYGIEHLVAQGAQSLSKTFSTNADGRSPLLTSHQFSLSLGATLKETLAQAGADIYRNAARLHHEKLSINETMIQPDKEFIAHGAKIIDISNYRPGQTAPVIAAKPVARIA